MAKLLIIEESEMLCNLFDELLRKHTTFDFDITRSYQEAKEYVSKKRYEFCVANMELPDAEYGEIIALVNKYNIAPIMLTTLYNEDFWDAFESANIVDFVLKEGYSNIINIVDKLRQLEANKKKTILVVDDSTLNTNFIKQSLLLHHFKVLTAPNGEVALERLEAHPEVELVITDYRMPIMDGLEFLKKVRKKRGKKSLKIVVLSDETNSYHTSLFLKDGANDYITKPFSRDEFYTRIYQNIETITL